MKACGRLYKKVKSQGEGRHMYAYSYVMDGTGCYSVLENVAAFI